MQCVCVCVSYTGDFIPLGICRHAACGSDKKKICFTDLQEYRRVGLQV